MGQTTDQDQKERTFRVQFGSAGEVTVKVNPGEVRGIPGEVGGHVREANRQALLAVRSALDWVIGRLEPRDAESEGASGPTRIRIQADEEETTDERR